MASQISKSIVFSLIISKAHIQIVLNHLIILQIYIPTTAESPSLHKNEVHLTTNVFFNISVKLNTSLIDVFSNINKIKYCTYRESIKYIELTLNNIPTIIISSAYFRHNIKLNFDNFTRYFNNLKNHTSWFIVTSTLNISTEVLAYLISEVEFLITFY
ncbi:unnamed protein product [Aphis gossypii]|uniref:Uncharacterized protein n=1 Tax=Aphis gossypii TaxID=80765 RepID=A0A9P0J4H2_APHGO|nr:unnamed protein product [Aphis gossypii]